MSELREVNLEHGMPTVQTALSQLALELRRTRSMGCTGLKIIHGYGSSGKGGKIRVQARSRLARMKGAGEIRDYIPGEEFSIFNSATLAAFRALRCPAKGPGSGAAQQWGDHHPAVKGALVYPRLFSFWRQVHFSLATGCQRGYFGIQ